MDWRILPHDSPIQFRRNGQLDIRADCNTGFGAYVLRGRTITIANVVTTKAGCPTGSLEARFLANLGQTSTYTVRAGILILELGRVSGAIGFSQLLP